MSNRLLEVWATIWGKKTLIYHGYDQKMADARKRDYLNCGPWQEEY